MTQRIDDLFSEISLAGGAAMNNLWQVKLPSLGAYESRSLNLLCVSTSAPGRAMNGTEVQYGLPRVNVVNGFGVAPIQMSFLVLNDGMILEYFHNWQAQIVDPSSYALGYYKDYVRRIDIDVLKKGYTQSVIKKQFKLPIPTSIKNRLPNIGPINFRQGEFDLQNVLEDQIIYSWVLEDAYPSIVNAIPLDNGPRSEFMQIDVEFTYKDWRTSVGQEASKGDIFGKAINTVFDRLTDKLGF